MHVMCHMRRRIHACHVRICTTVTSGRGLAFATRQQHISNTLATHQQHISNTLARLPAVGRGLAFATRQQHISNTLAPPALQLQKIHFLFILLPASSILAMSTSARIFSSVSVASRCAFKREKRRKSKGQEKKVRVLMSPSLRVAPVRRARKKGGKNQSYFFFGTISCEYYI